MLLDSNIIIYAVKPDYPEVRAFVKQHEVSSSSICRIETLGYHNLGEAEASKLKRLFDLLTVYPVTDSVIRRATKLRRRRRSLRTVDAIVASTALETNSSLATHDRTDFDWIDEIDVVDPVSEA